MLKPEVVFFGSGPVAAKSLELLLSDFEVKAVVTKPKPAHHRGSFPVLDVAQQHKLPIFTVSNKQELSELIAKKPFQTEIAILIDFGIIISQDVIDYFPKGVINSHFSLLPQWRGADPITFAILSGQNKTGVSLMFLVEAMDEGPVLACGVQDLDGGETTSSLTESLIYLSDALLKQEVPRYLSGESKGGHDQEKLHEMIPDYPEVPTYSRKLTKDDGILDFSKPAEVLEREIRGFIEWPKSRTTIGNLDVVITQASVVDRDGKAGTIVVDNDRLLIQCKEKALRIERLKPAGKQDMTAESFLAGYGKKLGLL